MYIATCLEGIEDICINEVKGKKILPGRVKFEGKVRDFNSVIHVYELIKKFKFKTRGDIATRIKKYPIKDNFKVVCERRGKHDFNSFEIQGLIGKEIGKLGYKLDFKKPGTIIFVDIIDDVCLIGVLVKENLSKRDYRYKLSADSINPCLAYSALKLAKCKKNDIIVDSFCKDGIICIEAAKLGAKAYGFHHNIKGARINAKIAKVNIELSNKDVDWLDTCFDKKEVKIVSYIPSYSKLKPRNLIDKLIKELFHQAEYVVKDYMVLISQKEDMLLEHKNKFNLIEKRKINIGENSYYIFSFKR